MMLAIPILLIWMAVLALRTAQSCALVGRTAPTEDLS
jgi:hypothetical protein